VKKWLGIIVVVLFVIGTIGNLLAPVPVLRCQRAVLRCIARGSGRVGRGQRRH
jgi:hypothetical protein